MSNLKVGIAGYGVVGRRRHQCMQVRSDMDVVAVCDRVFSDATGVAEGVKRFRNWQDLLKEKLDVLFVCLTNDAAPDVVIAGLDAGMHVFCEKPPGRTVADVRRVIVAEEKYPSLKLMYGFNHRYHDSVQEALQVVRTGALGRVIGMRGVYGKSKIITFGQDDWRTKRDIAGGGVLLDQGIHMVDLMRLFAGEFEEVHSFLSNSHWQYDVEDNAYALMRTRDGVVAQLTSSATQWRHRFELDINMQKGSVILSGILSGSKSYGAETLTVISADPDFDGGDPREQVTRYNKDPSWDREIADFAAAIIHDRPIQSGSSKDALYTMRLVYQIYHADPQWRGTYDIPSPMD
jgi:predicted dehydrogenase